MKKVLMALMAFVLAASLSGCGFINLEPSESATESGTSSKENLSEENFDKVYTVDEFCKLFENEKNFARDHSDELFTISGTIEKSSDVFLKSVYFHSTFESEEWDNNYKVTCQFEDKETIKDLSAGDTVEIKGKLYSLATSGILLNDCSLISVKSPNSGSSESQTEIPEPRETAIGKSDKDVTKLTPSPTKGKPVNNDETGNLRYSGFGNKGVNLIEYALSYYNNYFESDKEIHAVINFTDKTTTRISRSGETLSVTVFKYVKGEDYDVDLMFTGDLLKDYIVYLDNGDIEEVPVKNVNLSQDLSTVTRLPENSPPASTSKALPSSSAPTIVSKPEQTTIYVLNTNTYRVHTSNCRHVKEIEPQNYATTTDLQDAKSKGYKACGRCKPF